MKKKHHNKLQLIGILQEFRGAYYWWQRQGLHIKCIVSNFLRLHLVL